jgi:hypothetical protein
MIMKRSEIEVLVRQNYLPWVSKLPETRKCLKTVRDKHLRTSSGCSYPAAWMFTADSTSRSQGGVYCFIHLMTILSSGEEQVRIEDLLKHWHDV